MTWNLDLSHSSVEFAVKHMVISSTKGRCRCEPPPSAPQRAQGTAETRPAVIALCCANCRPTAARRYSARELLPTPQRRAAAPLSRRLANQFKVTVM